MPQIKPFFGLRPNSDFAEKVASPPYDVLSSEEATKLAKGNPYSFLHISKPEIDLSPETNLYDEKVYKKGAENLKKFIHKKILIQDEKQCFYLYRLIMGEHTQTGIVAAASVDDYKKGKIKIHEYTREDKEKDRATHVDFLNANTGPVFLTYHAKNSIDKIVRGIQKQKPLYDFTSNDGIRHTIWKVDNDIIIEKIQNEFNALDYLYISDGHHRSAAAARVQEIRMKNNPNHSGNEEYNYFLTVIFPDEQLYIMDYNRVVKDLNGLSESKFLDKIFWKFEITKQNEIYKPTEKYLFGMYLNNCWYKLAAKPDTFNMKDPVNFLDVSILHNNLMEPILGITNPRKDKRINFVGGIRGLKELEKLVDSGRYKVAFDLYPTSIQELMNVADSNKVMPPKSTWFEPKLRSGLIIHLL
ncbi:MAG: DUF1015 domain-containing protein [Candidatus Cloacimonetes bacterium]|nr:DUF1015 domain-containing protein [Candidatus Cloacimonadota bacterium]MBL7086037.1 DUF1015 domain-containing protein [Candidatus Cloacimonadota bacterium]